jgi:hypothetical protein
LGGIVNLTDKFRLKFRPTILPPRQIPTNTLGMTNPPLSSGFQLGGGQLHTLGNPQPGSNLVGASFYNPQQNIPAKMMPNPPYMSQLGGGPYNVGQGHGVYQNPRWPSNPQAKSFPRGWGQMSQPRLPFLATLNMSYLAKLMNDPVSHDPTCPPVPTKLPSDIPKFGGKNGEDPGDHITNFSLLVLVKLP